MLRGVRPASAIRAGGQRDQSGARVSFPPDLRVLTYAAATTRPQLVAWAQHLPRTGVIRTDVPGSAKIGDPMGKSSRPPVSKGAGRKRRRYTLVSAASKPA